MKKTLLAVALLLASTCSFAQVNTLNQKLDAKMEARKAGSFSLQAPKALKAKSSKSIEGTVDLIAFNDSTSYVTGTMANHTPTDWVWQVTPNITDIPDLFIQSMAAVYGNTVAAPGFDWTTTWFYDNNIPGFDMSDGLAVIAPMGAADVPGATTTTFNAYIATTNGISTSGMRGIDIVFAQYVLRFNWDQFFIDWSHDANFAEYDSIELNAKGVELDANESTRAIKVVNIPNGTTIPVISEDPSELTYFRIRYYSPAQPMTNGYIWMIDNFSYREAPQERIEVYNNHFYNAYSMIPEIVVEPDLMAISATVANTGVDVLNNTKIRSNFNTITVDQETGDVTYTQFGTPNETPDTSAVTLNPTPYTTGYVTNAHDTIPVYRRHVNLAAETVAQAINTHNDGQQSIYAVTSEITYINAATNEEGRTELTDTVDYTVDPKLVYLDGLWDGYYRWGRDLNVLVEDQNFTHGVTSDGYITNNASWSTNGYKVCLGFAAQEYTSAPVYARGVELVPAMDICIPGVTIKGSLMRMNNAATTYDDLIEACLDDNDQAIETFEYVLRESDLNTSTDPQYLDVMRENERTTSSGDVIPAYNKIYLEYTFGAYELEPNVTYYACYELVGNGKFAVGRDYDGWDRFGSGYTWSCLIFSPDAPANQQYVWGIPFHPSYTDFTSPMMRLVVSNNGSEQGHDYNASALNDANVNAANINVYPNPATSHATATYTLAQRGDVTITVTDLTGRVVLAQQQGVQEAGVTYNANLNVSALSNGTYFCTITSNGVKSTSKLVINR